MAVTKIPKGIELITQFVRGQFAKRSARNTGIASLKKASDSIVQSNAKSIEIILKDMGVDINKLKSTDDVLKHMNIHKAMMNQSLKQGFKGLDLDKGIKSLEKTKKPWHQGWDPKIVKTKPEDKKIPMFERHQKELTDMDTDTGMKFYSDLSDTMKRQNLEELELDYDTMFNKILEKAKRIDADPKVLLEAELGKKLTGKETTTQLLDIFKNRPKKASGGRIGMFGGGPIVKGGKWFLKNLRRALNDIEADKGFKNLTPDRKEGITSEIKNLIKSIEGGGPIPDEMIQTIRHDPKFATISTTRSTDPDLYEFEDVILNYGKKGDVSDQTIKEITGEVKDVSEKMILDDFDVTGQTKHAEGGRVPLMYGGDPGFAFEYGGSWADWHEKHRDTMPVEQYIQTKLPKERLPFREMQSGGLAYMLGEPTYMKYGVGGSVGHAPWLKPSGQQKIEGQNETPTPNVATRPDPMKAPRGLPSLAPKNMDPAYMQQQMMQKAMMGRGNTGQGPRPMANAGGRIGFGEGTPKIPKQFLEDLKKRDYHEFLEKYRRWKENYERRKDLAPTQEAAEGGLMRTGFKKGGDMSRRGFMKLIAGIAALPVIGKYFKPAAKVVGKFKGTPNLVVDITKTPNMPEWYIPLIRKVLNKGDEVTDTAATAERQRVHRDILPDGDEVTVTQNIDAQTIDVSVANPKNNYLSASGAGESPYTIQYAKGTEIGPHPDIPNALTTRRSVKEPDTLKVDEPYVRQAGPDTKDVEMEFDIVDYNPKNEVHDTSVLEIYATGKKVKPRGTGKVSDPYEGYSPDLKADDYASGGLAGLLGE